jgi:hypothetical protein
MRRSLFARAHIGVAAVTALLILGTLAGPVTAAPHDIDFPAGTACQGFDLGIDLGAPVGGSVAREFRDRDGNVVRVLSAGTGYALTLYNDTSGTSLSLPSNGVVTITRPGPDGVQTVTTLGHTIIILFPTDVPPGPATTLYVGRVVYTVDAQGTFTLLSTGGRQTDICAALG